jgi:hypothetical protein
VLSVMSSRSHRGVMTSGKRRRSVT